MPRNLYKVGFHTWIMLLSTEYLSFLIFPSASRDVLSRWRSVETGPWDFHDVWRWFSDLAARPNVPRCCARLHSKIYTNCNGNIYLPDNMTNLSHPSCAFNWGTFFFLARVSRVRQVLCNGCGLAAATGPELAQCHYCTRWTLHRWFITLPASSTEGILLEFSRWPQY